MFDECYKLCCMDMHGGGCKMQEVHIYMSPGIYGDVQ